MNISLQEVADHGMIEMIDDESTPMPVNAFWCAWWSQYRNLLGKWHTRPNLVWSTHWQK